MFSLLLSSAAAQSCGPTFNLCVRNTLVDTMGQVGPSDGYQACASLAADPAQYYPCLCNRFTGVLYCYNTYCPNDGSKVAQQQLMTQHCSAAQVYGGAAPTHSAIGPLVKPPVTISSTTEPTTPAQVPPKVANGAETGTFVAGVIGGLLALI